MPPDEDESRRKKRINVRILRAYCAQCRHKQSFVMTKVNHPLHLALTIATLGLWGISWAAHSIGMMFRPWRCKHCGWHKPQFRD